MLPATGIVCQVLPESKERCRAPSGGERPAGQIVARTQPPRRGQSDRLARLHLRTCPPSDLPAPPRSQRRLQPELLFGFRSCATRPSPSALRSAPPSPGPGLRSRPLPPRSWPWQNNPERHSALGPDPRSLLVFAADEGAGAAAGTAPTGTSPDRTAANRLLFSS